MSSPGRRQFTSSSSSTPPLLLLPADRDDEEENKDDQKQKQEREQEQEKEQEREQEQGRDFKVLRSSDSDVNAAAHRTIASNWSKDSPVDGSQDYDIRDATKSRQGNILKATPGSILGATPANMLRGTSVDVNRASQSHGSIASNSDLKLSASSTRPSLASTPLVTPVLSVLAPTRSSSVDVQRSSRSFTPLTLIEKGGSHRGVSVFGASGGAKQEGGGNKGGEGRGGSAGGDNGRAPVVRQRATVMFDAEDDVQYVISYDAPPPKPKAAQSSANRNIATARSTGSGSVERTTFRLDATYSMGGASSAASNKTTVVLDATFTKNVSPADQNQGQKFETDHSAQITRSRSPHDSCGQDITRNASIRLPSSRSSTSFAEESSRSAVSGGCNTKNNHSSDNVANITFTKHVKQKSFSDKDFDERHTESGHDGSCLQGQYQGRDNETFTLSSPRQHTPLKQLVHAKFSSFGASFETDIDISSSGDGIVQDSDLDNKGWQQGDIAETEKEDWKSGACMQFACAKEYVDFDEVLETSMVSEIGISQNNPDRTFTTVAPSTSMQRKPLTKGASASRLSYCGGTKIPNGSAGVPNKRLSLSSVQESQISTASALLPSKLFQKAGWSTRFQGSAGLEKTKKSLAGSDGPNQRLIKQVGVSGNQNRSGLGNTYLSEGSAQKPDCDPQKASGVNHNQSGRAVCNFTSKKVGMSTKSEPVQLSATILRSQSVRTPAPVSADVLRRKPPTPTMVQRDVKPSQTSLKPVTGNNKPELTKGNSGYETGGKGVKSCKAGDMQQNIRAFAVTDGSFSSVKNTECAGEALLQVQAGVKNGKQQAAARYETTISSRAKQTKSELTEAVPSSSSSRESRSNCTPHVLPTAANQSSGANGDKFRTCSSGKPQFPIYTSYANRKSVSALENGIVHKPPPSGSRSSSRSSVVSGRQRIGPTLDDCYRDGCLDTSTSLQNKQDNTSWSNISNCSTSSRNAVRKLATGTAPTMHVQRSSWVNTSNMSSQCGHEVAKPSKASSIASSTGKLRSVASSSRLMTGPTSKKSDVTNFSERGVSNASKSATALRRSISSISRVGGVRPGLKLPTRDKEAPVSKPCLSGASGVSKVGPKVRDSVKKSNGSSLRSSQDSGVVFTSISSSVASSSRSSIAGEVAAESNEKTAGTELNLESLEFPSWVQQYLESHNRSFGADSSSHSHSDVLDFTSPDPCQSPPSPSAIANRGSTAGGTIDQGGAVGGAIDKGGVSCRKRWSIKLTGEDLAQSAVYHMSKKIQSESEELLEHLKLQSNDGEMCESATSFHPEGSGEQSQKVLHGREDSAGVTLDDDDYAAVPDWRSCNSQTSATLRSLKTTDKMPY